MIEDKVKIHDKFSLEFKLTFAARKKQETGDFEMNAWIFIPNSLDINRFTYSKQDFYRDMKAYVRLITPVFLLRNIACDKEQPLTLLEKAFNEVAANATRTNIQEYEYQIKMFQSIFKSALRDEIAHILSNGIDGDMDYLINTFIENSRLIASKYRALRRIINAPTISKDVFACFFYGDEFMSNIIELHAFKLLSGLKKGHSDIYKLKKDEILGLIEEERHYKTRSHYPIVEKGINGREIIWRMGALKKYIESQLFLTVRKKREGVLIEQLFFSVAAGLSMIFATIVAFIVQRKYGNFTSELFLALVIGYMLKDRIKELSRLYFAHKLSKRFFDHKSLLSISNAEIGWYKESMDYIAEEKIPREVKALRKRASIIEADSRINDEKIIQYRILLQYSRKQIRNEENRYFISGVNNIIRFNVAHLITKMDNPESPLYVPDEERDYKIISGEKVYFLNFIMQYKYEEQLEFKRYRVSFNRDGIKTIEMI